MSLESYLKFRERALLNMVKLINNMKPSEMFEGEDSSLRKAYEDTKLNKTIVPVREEWRERFKKEFSCKIQGAKKHQKLLFINQEIESFIESELKRQREEAKGRINSLKANKYHQSKDWRDGFETGLNVSTYAFDEENCDQCQ